MSHKYIQKNDFRKWVSSLILNHKLIAPVQKENRFVFSEVNEYDRIRLDYDTTILPPKKIIFPVKQVLLTFDREKINSALKPEDKILFGVHPYDIAAIRRLDILFYGGTKDTYWAANRNAVTIIGSNVINHFPTAFFGSMQTAIVKDGYDIYLTDIGNAYTAHVNSDKGDRLIDNDFFKDADEEQIRQAEEINKTAGENCPEKIAVPDNVKKEDILNIIAAKVREHYDSPIWDELSERCFSCTTCNLVCPTCYCFDVEDKWNFNDSEGKRWRRWDACMAREFSEVTTLTGKHNFRKRRSERYRHRMMRKLSYLNDRVGSSVCVGCGRCAAGCTANIAHPLDTINKVLGTYHGPAKKINELK